MFKTNRNDFEYYVDSLIIVINIGGESGKSTSL